MKFKCFTGARVIYNVTNEPLNRVVSIEVSTIKDNTTGYQPLNFNKMYKCVTNSFLTEGGDSFHMIPKHMKNLKYVQVKLWFSVNFIRKKEKLHTELKWNIDISEKDWSISMWWNSIWMIAKWFTRALDTELKLSIRLIARKNYTICFFLNINSKFQQKKVYHNKIE